MGIEVVVGGIFAVLIVVLVANARKQARAGRERTWTSVASSLGGEMRVTDGVFWEGDPFEIDVTVDGIDVHVDTLSHETGKHRRDFTRLRAKAAVGGGVSLQVHREGMFSGLARGVGFQDVEVGDDAFDEAYVVKASDEMFAKAWLNRTVRNRIFEAEGYRFALKRGRVLAEAAGLGEDASVLEAAIRAVAAFADGKNHVFRVFKKVAKKLGGKAFKEEEGWATLSAAIDGIPVSVDILEHGTSHFNVATAEVVGAKLTPLVIANDPHEFSPVLPAARMAALPAGYTAWARSPDDAGAQLTEAVNKRIDALQPIKVRIDEERVKVYLVGICPPSGQMLKAARLAALLAAGQGAAPFR